MTALTLEKSKDLIAVEATIAKGIATFIEVGEALAKIRDAKLYKIEHETFEDYCEQKWGMSKAFAFRQIAAAEVVKVLLPMGDKPTNERQARPLTVLKEPEQQRQAWTAAVQVQALTIRTPTASPCAIASR